MGFVKNNDSGTRVEQERDPGTDARVEAEAEERMGVRITNNLSKDECTAIVWRAMDFEQSAIRAEDEWDTTENGGETVVAQAGLRENVLALGQDDRARIECLVAWLSAGMWWCSGVWCCVDGLKVEGRLSVGGLTL